MKYLKSYLSEHLLFLILITSFAILFELSTDKSLSRKKDVVEICHSKVVYLLIGNSVSVKYNRDGEVVLCK